MPINTNYNLRERLNIYSGIIIGATAPVIIGKCAFDVLSEPSKNLSEEAMKWSFSLIANISPLMFSVLNYNWAAPIPIYTAAIGHGLGKCSAESLRKERMSLLENVI